MLCVTRTPFLHQQKYLTRSNMQFSFMLFLCAYHCCTTYAKNCNKYVYKNFSSVCIITCSFFLVSYRLHHILLLDYHCISLNRKQFFPRNFVLTFVWSWKSLHIKFDFRFWQSQPPFVLSSTQFLSSDQTLFTTQKIQTRGAVLPSKEKQSWCLSQD